MKVFTYSEARRRLAEVLEEARTSGEVGIRRRDGQSFILRPETRDRSPLDVEGVNLGLSRDEIVELVREGRERGA